MKQKNTISSVLLLFLSLPSLLLVGPANLAGSSPTLASPPNNSSSILQEILDEYWQYLLQESLYLRSKQGLKVEELPDMTKKRADVYVEKARYFIEKLQQVKTGEITHEELLSREILIWDLENHIAGNEFFYFHFPITPYASPFPYINQFFTQYYFDEEADLDNYLMLLKQYPRLVENIIDILKYQYKAKYIIPKVELKAIIPYLEFIVQEGEKSPLFVAPDRVEELPKQRTSKFLQDTARVIEKQVNPAFQRLAEFVKGNYYQDAPEAIGLFQYPGGKKYYTYLVKRFTTLDISPEEIHKTGLAEVSRLSAELEKIMKEVEFKGDITAFLEFLRQDERFKPKTPGAIGEKLMYFNNLVKKQVDRFFNKKPKADCGVQRLAPSLEATMTFGYYQEPTPLHPKGIYYYNGSNLQERNILDAAALILHELVPGHHFQTALQNENENLPYFRRENHHTSYLEGWAEYASQLGIEMGVYQTPYDRCGIIIQDMTMAVRLVVDPGLNYFGWSREKASQYMKAHTLMSDMEIATETLRYGVDIPGQALAYKMGSLTIWKLRHQAEQALGKSFDIRRFHDAILASGSMPLSVLEQHIKYFITSQQNTKK